MDIRPPEHTATLFARPKPRDGALLRLAAWGLCATLSMTLLVFVAQTPAGGERIKQALAGLDEPAQPATASAKPDPAVRSLEARVAALTADRDRLAKRLAALENGFDDLTGSVGKPPSAAPTAAVAERTAAVPMVVAVAPPLINPLATPPAGVASILPETPRHEPEPGAAETVDAEAPAPEAAAASDVPLPPERIAAVVPAETSELPKPAKPAASTRPHPEFGIELATEANMEGLRKRWSGVKANYGPLLVGLSPVAVRDQRPGSTNVRLVAGPLPSIAAARQLCARFAAVNGDCWPARINPADVIQR